VVSPGSGKRKTGSGQSRGGGSSSGGGGGKGARGKRGFYILLGGLAVAGIATLSYISVRPKPQNVWQLDSTITLVPNQGHVIGSDTAPVEVVEFADFECPGCGSFATLTEPDLRSRLVNTGVVRFRFMDFPLEGHPNTRAAHSAAWCAGEQGKFWEMKDAIFQNQDRWSGYATSRPDRVLTDLARQIGVTVSQYESCVNGRKYAGQIQSNFDEGARRGVGRTPTLFIGNKKVEGAISYDELKRHVDEALAQTRATKK